ncbi:MAG: hypothetical protein HY927_08955 [Elusimicrobia bacterium]|nr:hypothetical protein [Elusimicrobiota bacterium]
MKEVRVKKAGEHMCGLADRKKGFEEMKSAARGARFICRECGRSASDKARLCVPETL